MMPMRSPRMMRAEKSAMTGAAPKVVRDVLRFEHQLAGRRGILHADLHLPDALAPLAALDAQLLERAHPALVARAPRLHALANPHLFLRQLLVEQRGMLGLDFERRALLQNVVIVVAGPDAQLAAIEFHDPRRQAAHEGAVVADEQQRAVEVEHHVLEPGDGIDIQMIRRLIQQQEVGRRDQRAAQHHAPPPAAGQARSSARRDRAAGAR